VKISAFNLARNASFYYKRNKKWPPNLTVLSEELKRSNSRWESFSGGSKYWKIEITNENRLKVIYLGLDADRCQKVFIFEPLAQ
jgi:hypothetical protein